MALKKINEISHKERDCLIRMDVKNLEILTREKSRLLEGIAPTNISVDELNEIKHNLARNMSLLEAAISGIRETRGNIIRNNKAEQYTYSRTMKKKRTLTRTDFTKSL